MRRRASGTSEVARRVLMSIVNTSEITIAPRAPAATFAQTLRVDEAEVDERWRGSESKASGARRRVWGVIGRFTWACLAEVRGRNR